MASQNLDAEPGSVGSTSADLDLTPDSADLGVESDAFRPHARRFREQSELRTVRGRVVHHVVEQGSQACVRAVFRAVGHELVPDCRESGVNGSGSQHVDLLRQCDDMGSSVNHDAHPLRDVGDDVPRADVRERRPGAGAPAQPLHRAGPSIARRGFRETACVPRIAPIRPCGNSVEERVRARSWRVSGCTRRNGRGTFHDVTAVGISSRHDDGRGVDGGRSRGGERRR